MHFKHMAARRGALEKAEEAYMKSPATVDPAHREVVFFCMVFSWLWWMKGVVVAGIARWRWALAKTAGRDFNGVCMVWQIFVSCVMQMCDTRAPCINPRFR
jgi:hypothetical protein